jgi:hypothetical protein
MIAGGVEFTDLPLDLRARSGLDCRTPRAEDEAIAHLVHLAQPARRIRQELLQRFRDPKRHNVLPAELQQHALSGGDQKIEIAALRGLGRLGGTDAVRVACQRSLNVSGMQAIRAAIDVLATLAKEGGLLALTATLLHDPRFVSYRLLSLSRGAARVHDEMAQMTLAHATMSVGPSTEFGSWIVNFTSILSASPNEDIRYGARSIATQGSILSRITRDVEYDSHDLNEVMTYFEGRVPGLWELCRERTEGGEMVWARI